MAFGDSHSTDVKGNAYKKRPRVPSYVELFVGGWERIRGFDEPTGSATVFAYPGDTVAAIASRAAGDMASAGVSVDGQLCLIQAGTNDVLRGTPLATTVAGYARLLDLCLRHSAGPTILQLVMPMRCYPPQAPSAEFERRRANVNRCLQRLASLSRPSKEEGETPDWGCADEVDGGTIAVEKPLLVRARRCGGLVVFDTEFVGTNATGDQSAEAMDAAFGVDCYHLTLTARRDYAARLVNAVEAVVERM